MASRALVTHRHPENQALWCLTHADTGIILATSWRYRTLINTLRVAWRGIPRRQKDLVSGRK